MEKTSYIFFFTLPTWHILLPTRKMTLPEEDNFSLTCLLFEGGNKRASDESLKTVLFHLYFWGEKWDKVSNHHQIIHHHYQTEKMERKKEKIFFSSSFLSAPFCWQNAGSVHNQTFKFLIRTHKEKEITTRRQNFLLRFLPFRFLVPAVLFLTDFFSKFRKKEENHLSLSISHILFAHSLMVTPHTHRFPPL